MAMKFLYFALVTAGAALSNEVVASESCDIAIAGGGPGGIHFAWRLLTNGTDKTVCIYERSGRTGGRIYSLRKQGPKHDLVVDLGAYRYAPKPYQEDEWYVYTPLLGALIDNKLKLPSKPYEPGAASSTVRKIVDAEGQNAGYATFVEAMLAGLHKFPNFKLHLNEELTSLAQDADDSAVKLNFASGLQVVASKVLLNLPLLPLLKVLDQSDAFLRRNGGMPDALQVPSPLDGVKLYMHYDNAWWANILNLTSGSFGLDIHNATSHRLGQLPDLAGRYHDGHTRCDGPPSARCRGYLEATYTYGDNARFFLNDEPRADPPYTVLDGTSVTGRYALSQVHLRLVELHRDKLEKLSNSSYNLTAKVLDELTPSSALLSYWGAQSTGYGGAIHMTRAGPLLAEMDLAPKAMAPWGPSTPVYVANEAFGALRAADGELGTHHGWAECSLVMAENVLTQMLGLAPPAWINASVYTKYVHYHTAPEELARRGGWHQG